MLRVYQFRHDRLTEMSELKRQCLRGYRNRHCEPRNALLHGSNFRCHSRAGGNPDFFCHAELVSASLEKDPEINSG
ncbi:hypothetical protein [Rickettsia endosymbiont of Orchestes rusci]|uniref:hypothetical protein n=1 Tax=Rickettsia endosymbiont of Orchestes rusci TaxID=3066250 RepID=UPI00313EFB0C